ncbi:MAG TPA: sugar transferase [Thermoleophilaceae bacterium]|jgi:lipopolysaccharide/colanic/teichoic acid biosynthesis glycosyltransferase
MDGNSRDFVAITAERRAHTGTHNLIGTGGTPVLELPHGSPGVHYAERLDPLVPARSRAKRGFDMVVALTAAVLLAPLFLLVALLIRLDSPGPIFYRCRRVGYGGETFEMLKFRKMHHRAEGAHLTAHADDRFTRAGKWLARLKADELPQLWNVVRGEMSLVGPRPESPVFAARYPHEFGQITRVRPGIVGLSQLAFAEESRILDPDDPTSHYLGRILPQKMALDRMYAERWHFRVDMRVVLWTAAAVLLRRPVAVHRETGKMRLRRR